MDKYGLIGYPLKHSFSQRFFSDKFEEEAIDGEYVNFEIPSIDLVPEIISSNPQLKGFNVTIPYKEQIIPYLDHLDSEAAAIRAVNVIKIDRSNGSTKLVGYNSDIIGFQNSIAPLINKAIHTKALILGTGGASKAVKQGLDNLDISSKFVSRTAKNNCFTYDQLSAEIMAEYTVIVNSSPLGTFPNVDDCPNIPYHLLTSNHLLYDLVYNPAETRFLRQGKERGAIIKNGAEMLELQAIAAWNIWNS